MAVPSPDIIRITGASENNLKQVSLEIKKKKITVFTGVSGSGKSSLCLDTIAAESRRELNETFPSFVQQYLPKYGRPEVEKIENLPVTIVIDQKKPAANHSRYIHGHLRPFKASVFQSRKAVCGLFRQLFLQSPCGEMPQMRRAGDGDRSGYPQAGGF